MKRVLNFIWRYYVFAIPLIFFSQIANHNTSGAFLYILARSVLLLYLTVFGYKISQKYMIFKRPLFNDAKIFIVWFILFWVFESTAYIHTLTATVAKFDVNNINSWIKQDVVIWGIIYCPLILSVGVIIKNFTKRRNAEQTIVSNK